MNNYHIHYWSAYQCWFATRERWQGIESAIRFGSEYSYTDKDELLKAIDHRGERE